MLTDFGAPITVPPVEIEGPHWPPMASRMIRANRVVGDNNWRMQRIFQILDLPYGTTPDVEAFRIDLPGKTVEFGMFFDVDAITTADGVFVAYVTSDSPDVPPTVDRIVEIPLELKLDSPTPTLIPSEELSAQAITEEYLEAVAYGSYPLDHTSPGSISHLFCDQDFNFSPGFLPP